VFGLESKSKALSDPLPKKKHRTSGLLYYLELRAGSSYPKSEVYLPVRHYAKNDDQIARGLSKFLENRGKGLAGSSYYDGVARLGRYLPSTTPPLSLVWDVEVLS
jgi:hypothetical protein